MSNSIVQELPPTLEEQQALTPDGVLQELMSGNQRFQKGELSDPNVSERVKATTDGQYPKAIILSCIDSRVPVEIVFDQSFGDIFVGRVAGNIENEDLLGSMEFATVVAGAKLVMVLGHENCGAIKGACDDVKLGNLTALLTKIRPAMDAVEGYETAGRDGENNEFVHAVTVENVKQTVANIRAKSKELATLEADGKIKIVGAIYSLKDGSVTLLETADSECEKVATHSK